MLGIFGIQILKKNGTYVCIVFKKLADTGITQSILDLNGIQSNSKELGLLKQIAWVIIRSLPLYYLNQVSFTFCMPQFSHL